MTPAFITDKIRNAFSSIVACVNEADYGSKVDLEINRIILKSIISTAEELLEEMDERLAYLEDL